MMGSGGQGSRVETMTRVCISMTLMITKWFWKIIKGFFMGKRSRFKEDNKSKFIIRPR